MKKMEGRKRERRSESDEGRALEVRSPRSLALQGTGGAKRRRGRRGGIEWIAHLEELLRGEGG